MLSEVSATKPMNTRDHGIVAKKGQTPAKLGSLPLSVASDMTAKAMLAATSAR
jgi:hypothetical protein